MQKSNLSQGSDLKTCLNCKEEFKGNFCWNCGQSAKVHRLDLKEIIEEFLLSPLHIHPHGLLFTFIWLFRAPGDVIRRYIKGERKLLHPAFRYLVLAGTLATIVIAIYHPFEEIHQQTTFVPFLSPEFFSWVGSNITFINLIAVPIFALGTYIIYKPKGYNYAENLALQAYIASQQLWILVVLFPVFQLAPSLDSYINSVYSVASVVYNLIVVMGFFKMRSIVGFLLSLLAFLYANVVQITISYLFYEYVSHHMSFSLH